jgi:hypothetical protein
MAGMTVNVHEAGNDHHLARVNLFVDGAGVAFTDMDDVGASDHEIRIAEIDMGSGGLIPGDNPVAIPEESCLGDSASHFRLHEGREEA